MVLEEIRRKVGDDFIVGIRIAIDQNLEGGLSRDDCLEIAQLHEESGLVDFLNLNYGRVDTEIAYVNLMPVTRIVRASVPGQPLHSHPVHLSCSGVRPGHTT